MTLNPEPTTSNKRQNPNNSTFRASKASKSVPSKKISYPKIRIDKSHINNLQEETRLRGHLFLPQGITGMLNSERQKVKTITSIPYLAQGNSVLKGANISLGDIKRASLHIMTGNDMKKHNRKANENIRMPFRAPVQTLREETKRMQTYRKIYETPNLLITRHRKHQSMDICKTAGNESLMNLKSIPTEHNDREYNKEIHIKTKSLKGESSSRRSSTHAKLGMSDSIDTLETKYDKWMPAMSTQQSFMRTCTEENTERFRRINSETEHEENSHKRGKSVSKLDSFRHTASFGLYKGSGTSRQEKGLLTVICEVDRRKRAEELRKESDIIQQKIYSNIESMTRIIQQKLKMK